MLTIFILYASVNYFHGGHWSRTWTPSLLSYVLCATMEQFWLYENEPSMEVIILAYYLCTLYFCQLLPWRSLIKNVTSLLSYVLCASMEQLSSFDYMKVYLPWKLLFLLTVSVNYFHGGHWSRTWTPCYLMCYVLPWNSYLVLTTWNCIFHGSHNSCLLSLYFMFLSITSMEVIDQEHDSLLSYVLCASIEQLSSFDYMELHLPWKS